MCTPVKQMKKITVNTLPIRLGQFLKLADIVSDGNEAKMLIQSASVLVNGQAETRRGRKLIVGDIVSVEESIFELSSEPPGLDI